MRVVKYRYQILNNSCKVKFNEVGCSMRDLDNKLADFISSHGGAYRCEVEYKWRFLIDFFYEDGYYDTVSYSILEYDELFLHDYRVGDIDI